MKEPHRKKINGSGEIPGIRKASWLSDSDTEDEAEEIEARFSDLGERNCRGG